MVDKVMKMWDWFCIFWHKHVQEVVTKNGNIALTLNAILFDNLNSLKNNSTIEFYLKIIRQPNVTQK